MLGVASLAAVALAVAADARDQGPVPQLLLDVLNDRSNQAEFFHALPHDQHVCGLRENLTLFEESLQFSFLRQVPAEAQEFWDGVSKLFPTQEMADLCRSSKLQALERMWCDYSVSSVPTVHYFFGLCTDHSPASAQFKDLTFTSGSLKGDFAKDWCRNRRSQEVQRQAANLTFLLDNTMVTQCQSSWSNLTTWVSMDLFRYSAIKDLYAHITGGPFVNFVSFAAVDPVTSAPVTTAAPGGGISGLLGSLNEFTAAVNGVTSAWKGIVDAFKTIKNEKITKTVLLGFKEYSQSSKVFKAIGIPAQYQQEFATALLADYQIPDTQKSFVLALKYAQEAEWGESHNLFSASQNAFYRVKTVYKSGDLSTMMASYFVVDLQIDFNLLDDIENVEEYESIAGGIFEQTKQSFRRTPHDVTLEDVQKLMDFFHLIQAQAVKDALMNPFTPPPTVVV